MSPNAGLLQRPQFHFLLAFALSLAGFWPSFFSQIATTDTAHLLHGLSATAWMAIPIIQAWLASHRRLRAHRNLGRIWLLLAPVVVASGLYMVQLMIGSYEQSGEVTLLKFAFLDIVAMTLFVTFLVLSVRSIRRRQVDAHARYMACTTLFALEPALERVFVSYVSLGSLASSKRSIGR
jgi:uncharacterized membrane protein YozB (DUF420 family)